MNANVFSFFRTRRGVRQNRGFTMVELLTVVLILGLLASIAVPQYRRSVYRAEMMEGLSYGKTIFDAALRYKSVNGEGPSDFNQLDIGFMGVDVSGDTFRDGNFTYTLEPASNKISVQSHGAGYRLDMIFPQVSNKGVEVPILCCPTRGDETGEWLCKAVSGGTTASGGCYEMK